MKFTVISKDLDAKFVIKRRKYRWRVSVTGNDLNCARFILNATCEDESLLDIDIGFGLEFVENLKYWLDEYGYDCKVTVRI